MKNQELIAVAKKRYPIGTTYKCAFSGYEFTVTGEIWADAKQDDVIYGELEKGCIYHKGEWAEITYSPASKRDQFMEFFRSENFHSTMSTDDCIELFKGVLKGSSDITQELLEGLISDYGITNITVTKTPNSDNDERLQLAICDETCNYIFEDGSVLSTETCKSIIDKAKLRILKDEKTN